MNIRDMMLTKYNFSRVCFSCGWSFGVIFIPVILLPNQLTKWGVMKGKFWSIFHVQADVCKSAFVVGLKFCWLLDANWKRL